MLSYWPALVSLLLTGPVSPGPAPGAPPVVLEVPLGALPTEGNTEGVRAFIANGVQRVAVWILGANHRPLSGCEVQLLNARGRVLQRQKADAGGVATLPTTPATERLRIFWETDHSGPLPHLQQVTLPWPKEAAGEREAGLTPKTAESAKQRTLNKTTEQRLAKKSRTLAPKLSTGTSTIDIPPQALWVWPSVVGSSHLRGLAVGASPLPLSWHRHRRRHEPIATRFSDGVHTFNTRWPKKARLHLTSLDLWASLPPPLGARVTIDAREHAMLCEEVPVTVHGPPHVALTLTVEGVLQSGTSAPLPPVVFNQTFDVAGVHQRGIAWCPPHPGPWTVRLVAKGRGLESATHSIAIANPEGLDAPATGDALEPISPAPVIRLEAPPTSGLWTLHLPWPRGVGWLTLQADSVVAQEVFHWRERDHPLPLSDLTRGALERGTLPPRVVLSLSLLTEGGHLYHGRVTTDLPMGPKRLLVHPELSPVDVLPNDGMHLALNVTDPIGRPVDANVAFRVVDDRLPEVVHEGEIIARLHPAPHQVRTSLVAQDGVTWTQGAIPPSTHSAMALPQPALLLRGPEPVSGRGEYRFEAPKEPGRYRVEIIAFDGTRRVGIATERLTLRPEVGLRLIEPRAHHPEANQIVLEVVYHGRHAQEIELVGEARGIAWLADYPAAAWTMEPQQKRELVLPMRFTFARKAALTMRAHSSSGQETRVRWDWRR